MSPFAAIADPTSTLTLIAPSAPVPQPTAGTPPRFVGEPVRWIAVSNAGNLHAFARSAVRIFTGTNGFPGSPTTPWTMLELSPMPGFAAQALLAMPGGLPVLYVLFDSDASTTVTDQMMVGAGDVIASTAESAPNMFFGICFQDRVVRDPALWSSEILRALTTAGVDTTAWAPFAGALAQTGSPVNQIYILDHVGRPIHTPAQFTVTRNGSPTTIVFSGTSDGATGISLAASDTATISFNSATHALLAGVEAEGGAFDGSFTLPADARYVQAADAQSWFADRDNPTVTQLARWNPNSVLEPIVDGNPYFARLVADMRTTIGGGGMGFAGWAFVKEALIDPTLPWPLIPGQDDTQFVNLITYLHQNRSQVLLLVNQFLQVEQSGFDDGDKALAVLWALFAANFPAAAFGLLTTDPAGFGVLMGCLAVATFVLGTDWSIDVVRGIAEQSTGTTTDLAAVSTDLFRWSPYPAALADNPLFSGTLSVAGVTIDDVKHFGVYHQKFVVGKTGSGDFFGYLGGIDINSDRIDSPLHRVQFPFHDVQARLTGPAIKDLIQSFNERALFDHGTPPFDVPSTPPAVSGGSHLVQIGRTYFKPETTPGFPFAPQGETVTHKTNIQAIKAACDFIYIEEQYFTPDNEYICALKQAAGTAQALIITVCMQNGQLYGPIRRTDVLATLASAWGTRMKVGAPIRRFLNPTPAVTVNLGRCVLMADLQINDLTMSVGPKAHVPPPPFWAFVGSELVQVVGTQADVDPNEITLQINRGPTGTITTNWGAKVDLRQKGTAVMCVNIPHIYVHAKLMIVDDVFLSLGSANMNRRGHFHDGELNALAMPQHLKRDPANPARNLRCQLWGEHLGFTPEMAMSLLSDPLSALPYFDRPYYAGNRWQPLSWTGEPTDTELGFSASDTIGAELMKLAIGTLEDADKPTFWSVLVDPTTSADLNDTVPGPEFP